MSATSALRAHLLQGKIALAVIIDIQEFLCISPSFHANNFKGDLLAHLSLICKVNYKEVVWEALIPLVWGRNINPIFAICFRLFENSNIFIWWL